MMLKKIFVIVATLILVACSSSSEREKSTHKRDEKQLDVLIGQLRTNKPIRAKVKFSPISDKKLSNIYREWAGTSYRLGGSTKDGIDCSAFMQEIFSRAYSIKLPRSTSEQQSVGKSIQKSQLKLGDLVFFRKNGHVGVYLGDGRFMHASTSEGVTISSLHEVYWQRHYTQSRRVF